MPFWKAGKNDDQVLDELKETQKQNADEFVKKQSLQGARCLFGIELLGKLLGDGRSTSGIGLSQESTLHDGTTERTEVDARMLIESFILRGNQCLY